MLTREALKFLGKKVIISGWVDSTRSHGKILFIDLRDKGGVLQLVFTPKKEKIYKLAESMRPEWVISVEGIVGERPKNMVNPKLETGTIELSVENLQILSKAKTLPFPIDTDGYEIDEKLRLKYRYLDIRRARMTKNLRVRQKVIKFIRDFFQFIRCIQ